ncbi:MAG: PorV/PorQ family protein [Elusimicrobia bacterium]|nr:PorV/PorQ family protein [Elusimicrobiota bacterium]
MFPESPFSSRSAGTAAASFLKFPAGSRVEAMGGAASASARGAEAVFYNPAGILGQPQAPASDLILGYSNLLSGAQAGSAAMSRSISGVGTVAAGLVYFAHGGQTAYDAKGDPVGEFSPSDFALSVAFSRGFADKVRAGAGLKVIRSSLQSDSAGSAAVDLGVQFPGLLALGDGPLDVGASVSHLGLPMRLGGSAYPLPMRLSGGVLWHVNPVLKASMDAHFPVDDDAYMSLGVELLIAMGKGIQGALRAGYNQGATRGIDGLTGVTAGCGLDLGRFRFDYAWAPYGDLGHANRASLGLRF